MVREMTLEEKFKILTAYKEGKRVEIYDRTSNMWYAKTCDVWDFDNNIYRIISDQTFKFKINDNLVYKGDENKPSPAIYTVTNIDNTGYTLSGDEFEKSPSVIEKEYISERDVLWYFEWRTAKGQFVKDFEVADIHNDTIKVTKNCRLTIEEAREVVRNNSNLVEFYTMLSLGFRLKRDS